MGRANFSVHSELFITGETESLTDNPDFGSVVLTKRTKFGTFSLLPDPDNPQIENHHLHNLLINSESKMNFADALLESHAKVKELIGGIEGVTVDEVVYEIDDSSEAQLSTPEKTLIEVANSTDEPHQPLLDYACLDDSYFRDLSFYAKKVLKRKLDSYPLGELSQDDSS